MLDDIDAGVQCDQMGQFLKVLGMENLGNC